jgi:L-seryl-tRNA(Ser) seleniumtransferase
MKWSGLRGIPSVDRLALALGDTELPHPTVKAAIRRELAALRKHGTIPGFEDILSRLRSALAILRASLVQPVINGTDILVHTNFGRAPLGRTAMEAVFRIGSQYNNLKCGLSEGARGGRAVYLEENLVLLCSAEALTVVNYNASGLVLILCHFCGERTAVATAMSSHRRNRLPKNHPAT